MTRSTPRRGVVRLGPRNHFPQLERHPASTTQLPLCEAPRAKFHHIDSNSSVASHCVRQPASGSRLDLVLLVTDGAVRSRDITRQVLARAPRCLPRLWLHPAALALHSSWVTFPGAPSSAVLASPGPFHHVQSGGQGSVSVASNGSGQGVAVKRLPAKHKAAFETELQVVRLARRQRAPSCPCNPSTALATGAGTPPS